MSEITWGQLSKSQESAETIEEAIDRIVAAHNDEPQAHLLSGQSIDEHRKENILDHPAGSVLADKYTRREFRAHANFESIDWLTTSGQVNHGGFFGVFLGLDYPGTTVSKAYAVLPGEGNLILAARDSLFQIDLTVWEDSGEYTFFVGYSTSVTSPTVGYGFYFDGSELFGRFQGTGSARFTSGMSITGFTPYVLRAEYSYSDDVIRFYVNDTLLGEISDVFDSWSAPLNMLLTVNNSDNAVMSLELISLICAASVVES